MKAILSFDLTDFEDQRELKRCMYSLDMALFVHHLKNTMLSNSSLEGLTKNQFVQKLRDELNELPFNINDLIR